MIGNATKTEVLFHKNFHQDKTSVFVAFRFEPASENENFKVQNQSFQHGSFQNMLVLKHFASSGGICMMGIQMTCGRFCPSAEDSRASVPAAR